MRIALLFGAILALGAIAGLGAYFYLYQGSLEIYVGDATGPWAHVVVTFSEVQAHEAGAAPDTGWHDVGMRAGTVDLATLVGLSDLLASDRMPPGKYTDIRIVVTAASGQMTDGTPVTFTVPSGELRANHPFQIASGGTTRLTVDIDLSQSIVHTTSGYIFKPVLGAITGG